MSEKCEHKNSDGLDNLVPVLGHQFLLFIGDKSG